MAVDEESPSHGELRLQDATGGEAHSPQAVRHGAGVRMHTHVPRQHPHLLLHSALSTPGVSPCAGELLGQLDEHK